LGGGAPPCPARRVPSIYNHPTGPPPRPEKSILVPPKLVARRAQSAGFFFSFSGSTWGWGRPNFFPPFPRNPALNRGAFEIALGRFLITNRPRGPYARLWLNRRNPARPPSMCPRDPPPSRCAGPPPAATPWGAGWPPFFGRLGWRPRSPPPPNVFAFVFFVSCPGRAPSAPKFPLTLLRNSRPPALRGSPPLNCPSGYGPDRAQDPPVVPCPQPKIAPAKRKQNPNSRGKNPPPP